MSTPEPTTPVTQPKKASKPKKDHSTSPRAKYAAEVITLPEARKYALLLAKNKKGNVAMLNFIAEHLDMLNSLRTTLLSGFGKTIMANVEKRLDQRLGD